MDNKIEPMAYIGLKPCGCLVFASVDIPECASELAKEVRYCAKNGYRVERVTCEYVRQMKWRCDEHTKVGKQVGFGGIGGNKDDR